ncbi:hypothetical protein BU16DRAFT_306861 [Lophium mytilinum]|uniref:Uncharacterized protein n=1 Tax=Lophium mytilinum TaxID=390894 RepID=A0A6A6R4Y6_9PEZI|nr:hypothetical protein BU16DRAFT_306861 [Lophium mytilinum]
MADSHMPRAGIFTLFHHRRRKLESLRGTTTSSQSIDPSLPPRTGVVTVPLPPFPLTPIQPPPSAPHLPTITRLCINHLLSTTWDERIVNHWTISHRHFLLQLYFIPFEGQSQRPLTRAESDFLDFFIKWWNLTMSRSEMPDPYGVFPHPFDVESEQSPWRERAQETARRRKSKMALRKGQLWDFGKRVCMGRKEFRSR